jgi:hypothetical protein
MQRRASGLHRAHHSCRFFVIIFMPELSSLKSVQQLDVHAGADPPYALRCSTRAGWALSEPNSGDHRQPNQQSCSKRGSAHDPQGFDAGKKVTGRKRHNLVDTFGLLLNVVVLPADVQDRDGARQLLRTARRGPRWPRWSPTPAAGPCRSSNEPSPGSAAIACSDATLNVTLQRSPLLHVSR